MGKLPRDSKHSPNDPVLLLDFSQVSVELVDLTVFVVVVVADDANEADVSRPVQGGEEGPPIRRRGGGGRYGLAATSWSAGGPPKFCCKDHGQPKVSIYTMLCTDCFDS